MEHLTIPYFIDRFHAKPKQIRKAWKKLSRVPTLTHSIGRYHGKFFLRLSNFCGKVRVLSIKWGVKRFSTWASLSLFTNFKKKCYEEKLKLN